MKNIFSVRKAFKFLFFFLFYISLSFIFAGSTKATCGLTIGDNTVSADCPVPADSTYGCDTSSGQSSTNTCTLNLTGGTLTVTSGSSGTTRLTAGSITLNGGTLALGSSAKEIVVGGGTNATWVTDGDGDGYAANFSTYYSATASGRTRIGLLKSASVTDCNDAAFSETNSCYSYSQGAYWSYGYGQGGYWRYSYSQSAYWRYAYSQSAYWRYAYTQSYYGSCFPAGTKVLMADGSTKEIQDIRPGDEVLSYDLNQKRTVKDVVAKLWVHPDTPGGYLVINGTLKVTGNHNMWVENKKIWLHADKLMVGDVLLNSKGERVTITSVEQVSGVNTVYNLGLPGENHNYFTEDILVHNWKL